MSLKKKSLAGFGWDLLGKLGLQGVGFIISIILARLLAPEDFGLLAIITVFTSLAGVFLDFGFSTALIQRKEVNEQHYSTVFLFNVAAGLLLGVIVFILAPFIAQFYDNPLLTNLLRVSSFSFLINSFGNVTRAHLRRTMNFKLISYSNVLGALISGVLAVFLAYRGFGVWSLVIQILLGQLIANIFLHFMSDLKFALKFNLQAGKELWGFSSKVFYSGLVDSLFINLDSLFIGKIMNPAVLGFYYRAKSLENFTFRYTAGSLASVLLPGLSSIQEDRVKFKQVITKVFHILCFISFFLSGLLLVTGNDLILLLFSNKWEPSVIIFQILIAGAFSSQIFSLFYNILLATGKANIYLKINVLSKSSMILNLVLLYFFNLETYLISFVIIKLITLLIAMIYVSNQFKFGHILITTLFKYLLLFAAISGLILFSQKAFPIDTLFISLVIITITYTLLTLITGSIFKLSGLKLLIEEIKSLRKAKVRAQH